jgi:cytochrome c oxidase subunit 4
MEHAEEPAPEHVVPVLAYVAVYVALLVLTASTVAAAYVDLGPVHLAVSLGIAVVKALLIIAIFMHVRYSQPLVWVFACAAFLWLAILIALSLADFLTRGLVPIPGK